MAERTDKFFIILPFSCSRLWDRICRSPRTWVRTLLRILRHTSRHTLPRILSRILPSICAFQNRIPSDGISSRRQPAPPWRRPTARKPWPSPIVTSGFSSSTPCAALATPGRLVSKHGGGRAANKICPAISTAQQVLPHQLSRPVQAAFDSTARLLQPPCNLGDGQFLEISQ